MTEEATAKAELAPCPVCAKDMHTVGVTMMSVVYSRVSQFANERNIKMRSGEFESCNDPKCVAEGLDHSEAQICKHSADYQAADTRTLAQRPDGYEAVPCTVCKEDTSMGYTLVSIFLTEVSTEGSKICDGKRITCHNPACIENKFKELRARVVELVGRPRPRSTSAPVGPLSSEP